MFNIYCKQSDNAIVHLVESHDDFELAKHRLYILNEACRSSSVKYFIEGDTEENSDLFNRVFLKYGTSNQLVVAMEECGELIQRIAKMHRAEIDPQGTEKLAEEIADVRIMCDQLCWFFKIEKESREYQTQKIARLEERIKS